MTAGAYGRGRFRRVLALLPFNIRKGIVAPRVPLVANDAFSDDSSRFSGGAHHLAQARPAIRGISQLFTSCYPSCSPVVACNRDYMTKLINDKPKGALKVRHAAEYLSVAPITVRRLIKRGLIQPNRALRHSLIPVEELDRFLQLGRRA
jgi:excisionase family DNA binding protein